MALNLWPADPPTALMLHTLGFNPKDWWHQHDQEKKKMGQNKMYDKSHELTWQPKRPINPSLCHSYEFHSDLHLSCHAANLTHLTPDTGPSRTRPSPDPTCRVSRSVLSGHRAWVSPSGGWSARGLTLSRRQGRWSSRALKSSPVRRWRMFWAGLSPQSRVDSSGSRLALIALHPPSHTRTWVTQDRQTERGGERGGD